MDSTKQADPRLESARLFLSCPSAYGDADTNGQRVYSPDGLFFSTYRGTRVLDTRPRLPVSFHGSSSTVPTRRRDSETHPFSDKEATGGCSNTAYN